MKKRIVAVLLSIILGIAYTPCYADSDNLNTEVIQDGYSEVDVESLGPDLQEEEVLTEEVPTEEVPTEEVPTEEVPTEEVPTEEVLNEEITEESVMNADAGEVIDFGRCGNNVSFQVIMNQNGYYDLIISGSGEMYSFSYYGAYWRQYSYYIQNIQIEDGVTSIGDYAFSWSNILTEISIPDSVTSIGNSAFEHCSRLKHIFIPDSVTSIGDNAFYDCDSFLTIHGNAESYAQKYASSKSIYFDIIADAGEIVDSGSCGYNVTYQVVGNQNGYYDLIISGWGPMKSFFSSGAPWKRYCTTIQFIQIEDGVTSIGDYAFGDCSVTEISIPDSVTSIGQGAFTSCISLESIILPDSVTSIGQYAFFSCISLESIILPDSIISIGDSAFSYCFSLTSITIPDSVTYIGSNAFYKCENLTSITIPDSVTSIGEYAFYWCCSLTSIIIPDSVTSIEEYTFTGCRSLESIILPDSMTSVGDYAFSDCNSLTSITIPDSVTSVGDYAFSGCNSLTSITIPGSVKKIRNWTFYNCSSLTDISISNGVTSIENYVFENCNSLTSITIPDSVTSIFYGAFLNCSGLTSITLSNSVTAIGLNTFSGCSSLTSIIIPDSVTSIGSSVFSGCSSLTSIIIPDSVTSIGSSAFSGCSSLTNITIPNNVTSIGSSVFSGCSSLTNITIPNSVTSIGWSAFSGCSSLTNITIPNSVTSIGKYAFYDCDSLTSITIPDSVTSIGSDAFSGNPYLTMYGYAGSYAQEYASNHYIRFIVLERPVTILSQPANVTAGMNAKISYSITANNAVSYQWQYSKNGGTKWINSSVAAGGNTDTVNLTVSASNVGNIYRCIVTGSSGTQIISETAGVNLIPGVVITLNPKSNAVAVGEYAIFTVETENAASFQWQYSKDGAHWYNSGAEGNTTDTLTVKGEQKSQGNRYRCVVTGIDGNKKKSLAAAMIVMTVSPKTSTASVGETTSFSLKAEGIESYQWQYSKDGGNTWYKSNADGATTDTVTFKVAASNRQTLYRCKLTTPDAATAFTKPVGFAE